MLLPLMRSMKSELVSFPPPPSGELEFKALSSSSRSPGPQAWDVRDGWGGGAKGFGGTRSMSIRTSISREHSKKLGLPGVQNSF